MKKSLAFILALTLVLGSFGFSFGTVDPLIEGNPSAEFVETGTQSIEGDGVGTGEPADDNPTTTLHEGGNLLRAPAQGDAMTDVTNQERTYNPDYPVSYTISKAITIESGTPNDEDFDFNIKVYKWSLSGWKWQNYSNETVSVHITAGSLNASLTQSIGNFKWYDFPIKVVITEVNAGVEGWSYDSQGHTAIIGLVDSPLLTSWIPNYITYQKCSWPNNVTFSNSFSETTPPPNCEKPGSIEITKRIDTNNQGDVTKFNFYIYDSSSTTIGGIREVTVGTPLTVSGLTPGAYTVTEVNIPDGYTASTGSISVTVPSDGKVTAEFVNSFECPDPPRTGSIKITKLIETEEINNGPVTEFHFNIINDAGIVVRGNIVVSAGGFVIVDGLTPGAYTVEEVNIPSGYTPVAITQAAVLEPGTQLFEETSFTNIYNDGSWDLQIPICKEATAKGSFGTQVFNFDISIQKESLLPARVMKTSTQESSNGYEPIGPWEPISQLSITLEDSTTSGCVSLNLSNEQLNEYATGYGDLWLRISEKNEGASGWTYDDNVYFVKLVRYPCERFALATVAPSNWHRDCGDERDILFKNSYDQPSNGGGSSGGGSGSSTTTTTTSPDPEPEIIIEDEPIPQAVEIFLPDAAIPATGGLGFGFFMLIGGAMTAFGVRLRKEDEE